MYSIIDKAKESRTKLEGIAWPPQTSKMDSFGTIVNVFNPLTIFTKHSLLDICGDLGYPS